MAKEYKTKASRDAAAYKRQLYQEGLCAHCRKPRDDERILCAACRERQSKKHRERTRERLENGLCRKCGKPRAEKSNLYCPEHWLKKIVIDRTGTNQSWREIADLLAQQNYRCSYTDIELALGENAQLDHKDPLDLGGTNDMSNLHWVDAEINRMKGKHVHSEFVSICKAIASRF